MPTCTALLWAAWLLVDPIPSWFLSDTTRFPEGFESLLYGATTLTSDVRDIPGSRVEEVGVRVPQLLAPHE